MRNYDTILQACHRLVTGLFLLLVITGLSQADHLPKGDLDGDGDVDFADFIIFSGNFDKPDYLQSKQPHTLDTIYVENTVVVRDTISVYNSDAGVRAGRMLGYWYLNFHSYVRGTTKRREHRRQILFQRVSETPNADGEFTVYGKAPLLVTGSNGYATAIDDVTVTYSRSENKYILRAERSASLNSVNVLIDYTTNPLADLEVKFSIRYDIQPDMTLKLSTRQWADTQYASKIQEPIIEIDYIKAIDFDDLNKVFEKDLYEPINDGLRRCSREEFMYKIYVN